MTDTDDLSITGAEAEAVFDWLAHHNVTMALKLATSGGAHSVIMAVLDAARHLAQSEALAAQLATARAAEGLEDVISTAYQKGWMAGGTHQDTIKVIAAVVRAWLAGSTEPAPPANTEVSP